MPVYANICSWRARPRSCTRTSTAFYASVEQRDDPRLRGKPVIVGAGSCSRRATRRRRSASAPRWAAGRRAGCARTPSSCAADVGLLGGEQGDLRVFDDTSPLVEGLSIDEAFLDVRGMERIAGTPAEIAARLRRDVRERVGLPITVGVARTKFLAKVASGVAKPDGLLVVPPGGSSRSCTRCRSSGSGASGRSRREKLHARGITTVARSRRSAEDALVAILGEATGRHLHALAHNRDRAACSRRRPRSIGVAARARPLAEDAGGDRRSAARPRRPRRRAGMRKAGRTGRTVVLRLRFDDFSRATRSHTLPRATAETRDDPRRGPRAARGRDADDRAAGSRSSASRSRTSTTTATSSSRCRSTAAAATPSTRRRRDPRAFRRRTRSRAACCSAATRA